MLHWELFCARLEEALGSAFTNARCQLIHRASNSQRATVAVHLPGRAPFPIEFSCELDEDVGPDELVEVLVRRGAIENLIAYAEQGSPYRAVVRFGRGDTPLPLVIWIPAA